jgi:hypothetical protein
MRITSLVEQVVGIFNHGGAPVEGWTKTVLIAMKRKLRDIRRNNEVST